MDTFNQGGGGQANLFQSPTVPSVKPAVVANAKFFIPTPASNSEQMMEAIAESAQEENATSDNPTRSNANKSYRSPTPSSSMTIGSLAWIILLRKALLQMPMVFYRTHHEQPHGVEALLMH